MQICEGDDGVLFGVADEPLREPDGLSTIAGRLSPSRVAWIVAVCLCLLLVGFLMFPLGQQRNAGGVAATDEMAQSSPTEPPLPEQITPATDRKRSEQLLVELHGRIGPFLDVNGRFPTGTVSADQLRAPERLSWLATIAATAEAGGPQPRWDRPWNDPVNDRFVRRQQPAFLNPALDDVVGRDRYPATHFVGVAGVGADAATLPTDHPRAGLFGHDRHVGAHDVRDGLAQTMLIVGVETDLGSWAAGGEATVRGFTAEPYLRGPDGFGTGQAGGMHVLMADGSVRFLAEETSPAIIRRMAAMNDGLPLDGAVPGEPSVRSKPEDPALAADAPSLPPEAPGDEAAAPAVESPVENDPTIAAAQVIADLAHPRDRPIDVPLADTATGYDVAAALGQKILKFDQPDPVPLRDLLRLVEEMAAVPMRLNELPPETTPRLAQPITLSLDETTVGEILRAIVERANLTFAVRPDGIVIQAPAEARSE